MADTAGSSWGEFETASPALAGTGLRLLYQGSDLASAFLATVAPDGGPRVHPVFPVVSGGQLWLFIVNMSPKYRDLVRNGRFALHSFPLPEGGEEFYVRGRAEHIVDAAAKKEVVAATDGRQGNLDFEALFRCTLQSVLHTKWKDWGTKSTWPSYTKWRA
ncbi:MAG: pyridoxamine 5'-phosphate oxidase family protein [Gammaproteobacteria bacterium]|nr:pyridoxamine 5'-phosphate oxidase family protein [Gammaproteobacteria bacterium]